MTHRDRKTEIMDNRKGTQRLPVLLAAAFGLIFLLVAWDLFSDWSGGVDAAHVAIESLVLVISGIAMMVLLRGVFRQRRSLDDLIKNTPADGLVCGFGEVNTHRTAICCYDYTVLAGTQGNNQHHKHDKIFQICKTQRVPIVFYTEGGGGRPGDTDGGIGPGLKLHVQQRCFLDLSRFPSCQP